MGTRPTIENGHAQQARHPRSQADQVQHLRADRHGDQPFGGELMQWIYEPNSEQVWHIADNLRGDDLQELRLSYRCPARDVVFDSWHESDIVRGMATDDGEPCGLCGVVGQRIWMLSKAHRIIVLQIGEKNSSLGRKAEDDQLRILFLLICINCPQKSFYSEG